MQYTHLYSSPLGEILLAADDIGLTGLWFDAQKYYAAKLDKKCVVFDDGNAPDFVKVVFSEAVKWLDDYFAGIEPVNNIPLHMIGTDFQMAVWDILKQIPYGETTTYGEIATKIAEARGLKRMSAQAVGGAVGHNPIGIIVPCHRVIGKDGSLTGYAGGLDKKTALLKIERIL